MTKPPPEAINASIGQLPDDFKKKHKHSQSTMTDFAPIDYHRPCPSAKKEVRDQLWSCIASRLMLYQWVKDKADWFQQLKYLFWLVRWILDCASFRPSWHTNLPIGDIVDRRRDICVTDTLVLHCRSIDAFEKLISFIDGPYTRLMIHGGDIKLDQLRRLMKDTVRKVEITANIELQSDEYDDAVQLILQNVRETRDNFNLESTPLLIEKV